jgi:large subunit ribosomal protein L9
MDIILLEKVANLGTVGQKVRVKSGYARNFLIPQGKATLATPDNVARFEAQRAEIERKAAEGLKDAQARAARLEGQVVKISAQAGIEGKLFGSIGTVDIADACTSFGVAVQRSEVRLPEGPIRAVGEHPVELHLHTDVDVQITVLVEAAEGVAE